MNRELALQLTNGNAAVGSSAARTDVANGIGDCNSETSASKTGDKELAALRAPDFQVNFVDKPTHEISIMCWLFLLER